MVFKLNSYIKQKILAEVGARSLQVLFLAIELVNYYRLSLVKKINLFLPY